MNTDQTMSVVRSILKVLGGIFIAHGATKVGSIFNAEDTVGLAMTIIGFITSHLAHKDDAAKNSAAGTLPLIVALLLPAFLIGCASQNARLELGGAYAPARIVYSTNEDGTVTSVLVASTAPDIAFAQVESAFDLAEGAIDGAFKFERNNRAMLWNLSPEIKRQLDKIRPVAWKVVQDYTAARDAYQSNQTPAGIGELQSLLAKIAPLSQAASAVIAAETSPSTKK